jgi:prepilin-type N-terminal cleavage/methylation domain-containing protein
MNTPAEGRKPQAFTLIEILVVITIIVVLLALIAPALDKAIYQAELAVCGSNQKAGVSGVITYAMDFRRYYPDRNTPPARTLTGEPYPTWVPPFQFRDAENSPDLRPLLHSNYMNINAVFNDPLSMKVDLAGSRNSTRIYGSYVMWFGYRYQSNGSLATSTANNAGPVVNIGWEPGFIKLGDKLQHFSYPGERFSVLIADLSRFHDDKAASFASHPDGGGVMVNQRFQDQQNSGLVMTISTWGSPERRGTVDMNFGYDDGSVRRMDGVERQEADPQTDPHGRMARLNQEADHRNPTIFLHMPRR